MENLDEIIKAAAQRAAQSQLPYQGALDPQDAHILLSQIAAAKLIDVRTRAEWEWVGRVPDAVQIEWSLWPGGAANPDFAAVLAANAPDKEAPLFFLCRSGVRSHAAASLAAKLGYRNAFNVLEGFEGEKNAEGHRNAVNGWRFRGLPWIQS